MPASNSLMELERPPILDKKQHQQGNTECAGKGADPDGASPKKAPTPSMIATVAPSDAPEDTPRIYGSASGFFTIACITTPQTERPSPPQRLKINRGRRISQTTS